MDWLTNHWQDILLRFGVTVEMSVVAGVIAMVVGVLLAALRVSPIPLARAVGALYIRVVRNTPLLVIMVIFSFGMPEIGFRPSLPLASWLGSQSRYDLWYFDFFWVSATVALGLYTASFVCEAIRSGINSVSVGQAEAARSVGMTFTQTLRHVVLPQALRVVIAPLASTFIAMTKNSSVAYGVGVTEATFQMKKLTNEYSSQIALIFIGFAIGYIVLVALISATAGWFERRLAVA